MSAVALSDQDGEYELDDCIDSRKDTPDPVEPMVTVDTTVATGLIEAYELASKLLLKYQRRPQRSNLPPIQIPSQKIQAEIPPSSLFRANSG
ncbi:hypothetical protein PtA15_12A43 [Puccinia triticina]|uniref:Uncharacterized protein n=1 Tax=Puccinia triticina TaxID=208348 RepID=A0ABY7D0E1_9BASI|nr:uncharacterized protein PtA15_12A43 [Puccinia triticina]WAQ90058.1 hypothetical protein PtA15_12A43 [Puccinia triticina]